MRDTVPDCDEYKFSIQTNIRIYLYPKNDVNKYQNIFVSKNDTNEYPNMFVSTKWYKRISEYICIKTMILIWYEQIFVLENIRMCEYICIKFLILVLDLVSDVEFLMCDTTESYNIVDSTKGK